MNVETLSELLRYDRRAMLDILEASKPVQELPERFHELVSHVLNAQQVWLDRMNNAGEEAKPWALRDRLNWERDTEALHDKLLGYLSHHSDESLEWKVVYTNSKGESFTNSKAEIFTHLMMHGQYHRGQLVSMLKGLVDRLPATDYIFYKRNS